MPLLPLEEHRNLFRDDKAMEEFARVLEQATAADVTPLVTYKNRHIMTALSTHATSRFLSDRLLQRFVQKPELLETFVQRLQELKDGKVAD